MIRAGDHVRYTPSGEYAIANTDETVTHRVSFSCVDGQPSEWAWAWELEVRRRASVGERYARLARTAEHDECLITRHVARTQMAEVTP
jgi:hypothetical protein